MISDFDIRIYFAKSSMRAFIATEIPEKIKDHLEKTQARLRRSGLRATWVKRKAMHLTLIFLGEISPPQAEKAAKILKAQVELPDPIQLKLTQLGAFPNLDFPKVVWLGLAEDIEKIKSIDFQIRKQLRQEKIPFDPKPFVAHLTLGRLRRMKPSVRKQISRMLKQFKLKEKPEFEINQIAFIKSQLTSKGPIYTILEKTNLNLS
jgi:2'-5' RNA ligase